MANNLIVYDPEFILKVQYNIMLNNNRYYLWSAFAVEVIMFDICTYIFETL